MDSFVDRSLFEYCEMDTDSAYMAIGCEKFEDLINSSSQVIYQKGLKGFCTNTHPKADSEMHWFPRSCCKLHHKHDKRTPGLFKIEFEGEEMIGLCSKTYIVGNEDNYKFSSKGANKKLVKDPFSIFRNVIRSGESGGSVNKGFRMKSTSICTYSQHKNAFSYLYCKRKLLDDGIRTIPLDIIISPSKQMKLSK